MIKSKSILHFFNSIAPFKSAEEWDQVGLVFGDEKKPIDTVVVALDLTQHVFEEAIKNRAQLIVTHHPFLLPSSSSDFADAPYKKELYHRLKNTGISQIVCHTNYDHFLMSEQVIKKMGYKAHSIAGVKYGKMVKQEMMLDELESRLKIKLGTEIFYSNIKQNFRLKTFAILPGAGDPTEIIKAHQANIDVIITSDIKWSTWITAQHHDIKLINISHGIEDVFTNHVSQLLQKHFKSLQVLPIGL